MIFSLSFLFKIKSYTLISTGQTLGNLILLFAKDSSRYTGNVSDATEVLNDAFFIIYFDNTKPFTMD